MADKLSKVPFRLVAGRIFDKPHLIEHSKMLEILQFLGPRLGYDLQGQKPPARAMEDDGPFAPPDPFLHMEHLQALGIELEPQGEGHFTGEGLAIIPVYGTLVQRSDWMTDTSGMMSYGRIERMMNAALEDPSVKEILWEFDTPGGEVAGAFDLADRIYAARGIKPMTSAVNELAASAGYLLASSVGNIAVSRTSGVGSIGVVAAHYDYSKAMEKRGVAVTLIYAGDKKVEGNPFQPLSADAKKNWQDEIDETYALFLDTVARNTGLSVKAVRDTQAAVYSGQKAVDAGLASRLNTFSNEASNAVIRIRENSPRRPYVGMTSTQMTELGIREKTIQSWDSTSPEKEMEMTLKAEQEAKEKAAAEAKAKAEAEEKAKAEAAAKAKAEEEAKAKAANSTNVEDAVKAERARAKAISELPEANGREKLAQACIDQGMTVEASKAMLAAAPKRNSMSDAMDALGGAGIKGEESPDTEKKPYASSRDHIAFYNTQMQKGAEKTGRTA